LAQWQQSQAMEPVKFGCCSLGQKRLRLFSHRALGFVGSQCSGERYGK
jgi:hypothetical protein